MVALLRRNLSTEAPRNARVIDRNHELARGLGFFPMFGIGGSPVDLVNGIAPSAMGSTTVHGPRGGLYNHAAGTGTRWLEWSNPLITAAFAGRTEMSYGIRYTVGPSFVLLSSFMSICEAAGGGYNILGNSNGGGKVGGYNNLTNWSFPSLTSLPVGGTFTFLFSGGAGSSVATMYSEAGGLVDTVALGALGTLSATLSRIRLGNERGSSAGGAPAGIGAAAVGEITWAAAWNRRLSNTEMQDIADQPFQLLQQRRTVSAFSPRSPFRGWGIQLAA